MTFRSRLVAAAALVAVLALAPACAGASRTSPAAASTAAAGKTATTFSGTPTLGALFPSSDVPFHSCSASVIASANRSVIMTAAHCVTGHDAGYTFAPDYHDGKAPYGMWQVTAAYGAPAWVQHFNTHDDWAFLVVAPRRINGRLTRLQTVTGANRLGTTPAKGQGLNVPAYPLGLGGSPIHCHARVFFQGVFPGFHCGGYVDGTSGAPWLVGAGKVRRLVGVIGGLHQGGCEASTSYSSPLGKAAHVALARAAHDKPADHFPSPPGDGCS